MKRLEFCCGCTEDVKTASQYDIDSIELNSALSLGGLTPTLGTLKLAKEITDIPLHCMVRAVPGGFVYNNVEFETMVQDATLLLKNGADAIVFGCLTNDLEVDVNQTKTLIDLAHSYNRKAIFHMAISMAKDILGSYQKLIDLGIDLVLSKGDNSDAIKGLDMLKEMNKVNPDKLMIGAGINPETAHFFEEFKYLHASCKKAVDRLNGNDVVDFDYIDKNKTHRVHGQCVNQLVKLIK